MGRHRKIDSRTTGYRLRMNKEEVYMLETISKNEGISKAEVFRKALRLTYDLSKNGALMDIQK